MNKNIIEEVFSVYEVIKDSMKVTKRSINQDICSLHNKTIFSGEQRDILLNRITTVEKELDDIMVLSLFASFERELRVSIQNLIENNICKSNTVVEKLANLTRESIERWSVPDMIDILGDVVSEQHRMAAKQIYEYRNWVAHGKNPNKLPPKTGPKQAFLLLSEFMEQATAAI